MKNHAMNISPVRNGTEKDTFVKNVGIKDTSEGNILIHKNANDANMMKADHRCMFDKLKFSLCLVLYIALKTCAREKGTLTIELSNELGLRQKAWWKIQQAMKSRGNYPFTGEVHVGKSWIDGVKKEYANVAMVISACDCGIRNSKKGVGKGLCANSRRSFFKIVRTIFEGIY